jgi:hypothetical protein
MAPDAILIEDALALRLLIIEGNRTLWVIPIWLDVIRAAKRIICGRCCFFAAGRNTYQRKKQACA